MNFTFPWPYSQGEWLAFGAAAFTVLCGLVAMFAPRLTLRLLRLEVPELHPRALSEPRALLGGFYLGIGLSALVFAQPLIYMALGVAWGLSAFGRIVSMMSDRANTLFNWIALLVTLLAAGLPLAFALGFVR
ncbi:AGROH133_08824 family phage infection protein [Chelativorans intermedius]|uniref:DUF4345 family protein n=1 Tax=Chelativorans intermedius TaxID=515947 RepID=A0ABV6DBE2_9HYPH|nr:DUF4345 family protein [Chelativorans intermedius]MCT8999339.1 DUF4345 family protein [Chelativorans intermedius]